MTLYVVQKSRLGMESFQDWKAVEEFDNKEEASLYMKDISFKVEDCCFRVKKISV